MLGAALSPDGTRVARADLEGYLRVLNAATGTPVLPAIRASANYLYSVAWSSDGSRLVTAGSDGTVRLYDTSSGRQIGTRLPVPGADLGTDPRRVAAILAGPPLSASLPPAAMISPMSRIGWERLWFVRCARRWHRP
jgi:WD40 repeat protein